MKVKEIKVINAYIPKDSTSSVLYVLQVILSSGECLVLTHRYNDFFEFQLLLIEKFPKEAGRQKEADRILPSIPGKVALFMDKSTLINKRKELLEVYCNALIKLPSQVSECSDVISFFTPTKDTLQNCIERLSKKTKQMSLSLEDISKPALLERYVVIKEHKKQGPTEISVPKDQVVEVMEKKETGWWQIIYNIDQGWFPSAYLRPVQVNDSPKKQLNNNVSPKVLVCAKDFKASRSDEISLKAGCMVELICHNSDGWWKVRSGSGAYGLAPANILHPLRSDVFLNVNDVKLVGSHSSTRPVPVPPARTLFKPLPSPPRPPPPVIPLVCSSKDVPTSDAVKDKPSTITSTYHLIDVPTHTRLLHQSFSSPALHSSNIPPSLPQKPPVTNKSPEIFPQNQRIFIQTPHKPTQSSSKIIPRQNNSLVPEFRRQVIEKHQINSKVPVNSDNANADSLTKVERMRKLFETNNKYN